MTFEQIEYSKEVYINKLGIVFTPMPNSEIVVSFQLDSKTAITICKPVQTLYIVFRGPDMIDFYKLSNYLKFLLE